MQNDAVSKMSCCYQYLMCRNYKERKRKKIFKIIILDIEKQTLFSLRPLKENKQRESISERETKRNKYFDEKSTH